MPNSFLESSVKQFEYYKSLGDKAMAPLTFNQLSFTSHLQSNSIAVIIKHLSGNMLSRWTNFLTEDGEKEWRNRDEEFKNSFTSKKEIEDAWEKGWNCLFTALRQCTSINLEDIVHIRNQGHTITEAINRQSTHYAYHIGQLVFLSKMTQKEQWKSLSIPKNASQDYNASKFAKEKSKKHFTEDL